MSSLVQTPATTLVKTEFKSMSVKDFMETNKLTIIPEVRANTNGYPYITFVNEANVAENIYFSKKQAGNVTPGQVVGRGFFNPFKIGFVKNEAGEARTKLVSLNGERLSAEDLF